ncbi:MAG: topoisomerase DNA-binding C4 zinc finger domain-containing protein [Lachnospiraceae bacterium]|nr:topoisomerase DNA-binding C4 zinc finger domain-containing protein [Lachnospiraceae bacterium]
MLSDKKGNVLFKYVPDYVIFDLETTGVSCEKDEVVEISAVKVLGGEAVDEFSTLVNPGMHIPKEASAVNNITDDMVKDCPHFEEALSMFMDFAGSLPLVGHNIIRFDIKFLYRDAWKFWGKTPDNDLIDTLDIANVFLPNLEHHRLTDLAEYYGISPDGAHRALFDCRMNRKVFECLKEEIANPSPDVKKCPECGNYMVKRKGKYGPFWGCRSYPDCRYTIKIR